MNTLTACSYLQASVRQSGSKCESGRTCEPGRERLSWTMMQRCADATEAGAQRHKAAGHSWPGPRPVSFEARNGPASRPELDAYGQHPIRLLPHGLEAAAAQADSAFLAHLFALTTSVTCAAFSSRRHEASLRVGGPKRSQRLARRLDTRPCTSDLSTFRRAHTCRCSSASSVIFARSKAKASFFFRFASCPLLYSYINSTAATCRPESPA